MEVKILEKKRVLDGFFKVDDVILQHEKFSGSLSKPIRRLNLERGEAVAILIYLQDRNSFVSQFVVVFLSQHYNESRIQRTTPPEPESVCFPIRCSVPEPTLQRI